MKIHLFVEKFPDQEATVVGAWDEYMADENYEGFEEELAKHQKESKEQGGEVRLLDVEIPDDALAKVFAPLKVKGKVGKPEA